MVEEENSIATSEIVSSKTSILKISPAEEHNAIWAFGNLFFISSNDFVWETNSLEPKPRTNWALAKSKLSSFFTYLK